MKILIGRNPLAPEVSERRPNGGASASSGPVRIVVLKQAPNFPEILERILQKDPANGAKG